MKALLGSAAIVAAMGAGPAAAVVVDATFDGYVSGTTIPYSLSFTADLPGIESVGWASSDVPGLETTLSLVVDGTEVFNETTASLFEVQFSSGAMSYFRVSGDLSGDAFNSFVAPDFIIGFDLNTLNFSGYYQPTSDQFSQIQFDMPYSQSIVCNVAAVPLPASFALMLGGLGGLGGLGFVRRRKARSGKTV